MKHSDWIGMSHMSTLGLPGSRESAPVSPADLRIGDGFCLVGKLNKVLLPKEGMDFVQGKGSNFVQSPSRSDSL